MARRLILENLMRLAQGIGANPSRFMGTKTNISFLGKGPTKNPLFQGPVPGLEEHITSITLQGQRGAALDKPMISAVEDAMGFATANKLNDIQLKALTVNLESLYKGLHPPVLPMASVTDIAPGIEGLRRFPKETHKFFGRPLKDKDFAEIDRMVMEGKIPDAQGRTWNLRTQGPGTAGTTAALDQKTGMSRAIARQILQQDTRIKLKPEELFMLKEGKGEPLDLMKKYYGRSVFNLDEWLDRAPYANFTSAEEAAAAALKEIELIPQFAEGGLAGILQVSGMKHGGRIGFRVGKGAGMEQTSDTGMPVGGSGANYGDNGDNQGDNQNITVDPPKDNFTLQPIVSRTNPFGIKEFNRWGSIDKLGFQARNRNLSVLGLLNPEELAAGKIDPNWAIGYTGKYGNVTGYKDKDTKGIDASGVYGPFNVQGSYQDVDGEDNLNIGATTNLGGVNFGFNYDFGTGNPYVGVSYRKTFEPKAKSAVTGEYYDLKAKGGLARILEV